MKTYLVREVIDYHIAADSEEDALHLAMEKPANYRDAFSVIRELRQSSSEIGYWGTYCFKGAEHDLQQTSNGEFCKVCGCTWSNSLEERKP